MFGLKERPYPGHVLKSFLYNSDNKNFDFFTFHNLSGYFSFFSFWPSSKFSNIAIHPYSDYF